MTELVGPSEHLSWAEMACHDEARTAYPFQWRLDRAVELAKAFESLRAMCGFPLIVNSAYRTPAYNARIGGARLSQHVEGRALDLHPLPARGYSGRAGDKNSGNRQEDARRLKLLGQKAEEVRAQGLLRGIGYYADFVHVDVRPGGNATWYGSRTVVENQG